MPQLTGARLLVTSTQWQQRETPVEAVGLACHSSHGPALFLTERYAAHEIHLGIGNATLPTLREARGVDACLAHVPEFHGAGLVGMSLECPAAGRCSALILGAGGTQAL